MIDSGEVRLAPFGNIYVAQPGTAVPTTATGSLNAGFTALGYVDETGVTITPKVNLTDIMMWQSAVPVKTTLNTIELQVKLNMGQVNFTNWDLYFFNESFSNNFGEAALTISSTPPSQEVIVVVEWVDDEDDQTRLVLPRAVLADRDALKLIRKDAQIAGLTFRALDASGVLARVYSENPDLTPAT
jgi:hypothetical protein